MNDSKLHNNVIEYLSEVTGAVDCVNEPSTLLHPELPLYLQKKRRDFAKIEGVTVVLEQRNSIEGETPGSLKRQKEILEERYGMPVVFCFDEIESFQRKRLIQNKIGFIIPYKQMYIPSLYIHLKEFGKKDTSVRTKFSPAAQCILLFHLQIKSVTGLSFKEIGELLPYTSMTVTRSVHEFLQADLCRVSGTKLKEISFNSNGKALWERAKLYLSSPVRKTVFTDKVEETKTMYKANETALCEYTSLGFPEIPIYAVSSGYYKNISENRRINGNKYTGEKFLEIWSYNPAILSKRKLVDPLSLFLSLRENRDERIQIALNDLLSGVRWSEG